MSTIFEQLVEKFGGKTAIVEELIVSTIDNAQGLIDREAAIEVLAAEHGIRKVSALQPRELKITPIPELREEDVGGWFNVKAFIREVYPESQFMQDNALRTVRNVLLQEGSTTIRLAVWGDDTQRIMPFLHKVVIIKGAQFQKNKFTRKATGEEVIEFRLSMGRYSDIVPVPSGQGKLAD